MKIKLLLIIGALAIITVQAEKYTIFWDRDENIEKYSVDVSCVETGFGTMNRVGNALYPEFTVDLMDGFNYTIKVIAYDKQGKYAVSNTLKIKTKSNNKNIQVKPPIIRIKDKK